VLVEERAHDEFVELVLERAGEVVLGHPLEEATTMGPLNNEPVAAKMDRHMADAGARGARVLAGGRRAEGFPTDLYYEMTVVDAVTPETLLFREESFGPVVSIIEVDSTDEAVAVANDTEYGLSAAVFGRDAAAALDVARRIRSGICHINGATVHDEPQMPFGGVGASGWGRFGSRAALEEFTELRWITIQSGSRHYPI